MKRGENRERGREGSERDVEGGSEERGRNGGTECGTYRRTEGESGRKR